MYSLKKIVAARNEELLELAISYQIDPTSPMLKKELISKIPLVEDFTFNVPTEIPLRELICNRLRNQDFLTEIRADSCFEISGKIADNLIRVASTRIFQNPIQSFNEPITNALDAYLLREGKRPMGKFGLGFYSLFFWINEYPGSTIEIYSNADFITPWRAIIDENFILQLRPAEIRRERFIVTLKIQKLDIEDEIIDSLTRNFQFVTTAEIMINDEIINPDTLNHNNKIKIIVEEENIDEGYYTIVSFTDYALGIPLYQISDLLVPAISTKTIRSNTRPYLPKIGEQTSIKPGDGFYILVGEIVIYSGESNLAIIVQLSSETPVPVSRDDILISNRLVKEEFEMNVLHLLELSLRQNPKEYPYQLIKALENYPTGEYFVKTLKNKIQEQGYFLVPYKYFNLYQQITTRKLVGIDMKIDLQTEEIIISENSDKILGIRDIFIGKIVYYVREEDVISFGDSIQLVFLGSKYQNVTQDQFLAFSIIFKEHSLLPFNADWGRESIAKIKKNKNPAIQNLICRLNGLSYIFSNNSVEFCTDIAISLVKLWIRKFPSITARLIAGYIKLCDTYKPNEDYGSVKKELKFSKDSTQLALNDQLYYSDYYLELFERIIDFAAANDIMIYIDPEDFSQRSDILDQAKNLEEFLYLLQFMKLELFSVSVADILDFWRTEQRNKLRIELMMQDYILSKEIEIELLIRGPLKIFIQLFNQRQIFRNIEPTPPFHSFDGEEYYLSRYLQNAFEGKDEISAKPGDLPIQLIEIAINEGTTKGFIEAMITETFQNARDAGAKTIDINTGKTGNLLSYSIYDNIGIPPEGIISLSIPFLSSKKASESQAGEMGSGFFNVYRNASLVHIKTTFNGFRTEIIDLPIRENERVVDVKRRIQRQYFNFQNGTTITVYFHSKNPEKDLAKMIIFSESILPLSSPIILNNKVFEIPSKPVSDFDSEIMTVRRSHFGFQSYLLTKGVPFAPLLNIDLKIPEFLIPFISFNLIVNLKKNFTPTQSRTKIRLEDDEDVRDDLLKAIYFHILELQLENPDKSVIPNWRSEGDANQILPEATDEEPENLSEFIWNYSYHYIYDYVKRIESRKKADFIEEEINPKKQKKEIIWFGKKLKPRKLRPLEQLERIKKGYIESSERPIIRHPFGKTPESELELRAAEGWMKSKSSYVNIYEIEIVKNLPALAEFFDIFVKSFVKRIGLSNPPSVEIIEEFIPNDGEYSPSENKISINIFNYHGKIPNELTVETIRKFISENESISKTLPASTLIHELEHFRRGTGESYDAHQPMRINGVELSFDQCANYFYDKALENGLIQDIHSYYESKM
jgi:hypothetical protein